MSLQKSYHASLPAGIRPWNGFSSDRIYFKSFAKSQFTPNGVRSLQCRISPLSRRVTIESKLVSRKVNNDQWFSYWGLNKKERLQKILESLLLAYGGIICSN